MELLQVNATSVNRAAGEGAKKARVAVAVEGTHASWSKAKVAKDA